MGPEGSKSHVTTRVMGTYGYAAPEYVSTGLYTISFFFQQFFLGGWVKQLNLSMLTKIIIFSQRFKQNITK